MIFNTRQRFNRSRALKTAGALTLMFGIGGVVSVSAQDIRSRFAANDAGRTVTSTLPMVKVAAASDPLRARIEAFSEKDAKQFYLGCSGAALRGQLSGSETATCSIGYDVLLKRHFGGDFRALLAWSRSQPHHHDEAPMIDGD